MRQRIVIRIVACLAVAAAFLLAAAPARADKLVVFKNGKSMRAKSVRVENGWTRLEFDGGNLVGVRSIQIASIEESTGAAANKADAVPNQASVGGAAPGGFAGQPSYAPPEGGDGGGDDFQQPQVEAPPPGNRPVGRAPSVSGARPFGLQQPQQMGSPGLTNRRVTPNSFGAAGNAPGILNNNMNNLLNNNGLRGVPRSSGTQTQQQQDDE